MDSKTKIVNQNEYFPIVRTYYCDRLGKQVHWDACQQCIDAKQKRTAENCIWIRIGGTLKTVYDRICKQAHPENDETKHFNEMFRDENGKFFSILECLQLLNTTWNEM